MIQSITDLPFHPAIARWFNDHFAGPSPPQAQGWPVIASGEHTLILAPTGSGKTLSAFLWCIDDLFKRGLDMSAKDFDKNKVGVHTLYISPLKALNNDIHRNVQEPLIGIKKAAHELGATPPDIRALVRTGDTPASVRQRMVKKPPHILITTPESLYLLITSEKGREIFRHLRYLIVDEIHALSNNKRGVHLSLSTERLMRLCGEEPVRIGLSATQKPLERIARFLGGQTGKLKFATPDYSPRPVTIVDCGGVKNIDLQVISPLPEFAEAPSNDTIWPAAIAKVYDLICEHDTTLVFANMRTQTEKIARMLNDRHRDFARTDEEIALAHHGSISREARYDIEAKLKAGEIPCVVATSSLELGIDIGSVDLVIQLGAPQNVSSALQRIGRSGHVLSATSKGRIMPLHPGDLDDSVAIARAILSGDIEETTVPQNCLDVLAQQIIAEVAQEDWSRSELYALFRQSYCYRDLTESAFNHVLEMLAGRYEDTELKTLKARLTWDKVNDQLIARRGARFNAIRSGGTIPDRGYYGVYIAGTKNKVGEVDEEFTFERQPGEVFILGNSEWRIEEITPDKVVVTPMASIKPIPPFWRADPLYRDYPTLTRIGAFRQELLDQPDTNAMRAYLSRDGLPDNAIIENMIRYLKRQRAITGVVPTDRQIVAEWFYDQGGEPFLMIHAPFGARVNGGWSIALVRMAEQRYERQFQSMFDDDGILIRFSGLSEPPPVMDMLTQSADTVETLLTEALIDTPIFFTYFRYNAGRALLLPRERFGKRTPLWLHRLRTADLLQAVRNSADFPILIETYREVLEDVFDLPNLKRTLRRLQRTQPSYSNQTLRKIKGSEDGLDSGESSYISIHFVETDAPSPMASGIMWRFLSTYLYQYDIPRTPAAGQSVASVLLSEILSDEHIPPIVTQDIVDEVEAAWQHLNAQTKARDAEELFAIIEKLGPTTMDELEMRATQDVETWLAVLREQGRIEKL